MSDVTVFCFFASYTLAVAIEATRAVRGLAWLRWPAIASTGAGLVAHSAFLVERARTTNLSPLLSSGQDWLLVVAWVACVLYLFFVAYDGRVGIGLFVLPLILLLVGVTYFINGQGGAEPPVTVGEVLHGWVMLHAAFLLIGIVAVVAGVVFSLMYLVQHRRLRHKQARPVGLTLLSLERLARWNRWSVIAAVPLLSLGLAVGFLLAYLAERQGELVSFWDPVVIASTLAWVVMVVVLGRAVRSERSAGKAVATRTLLAFGFLLTTLLGLQIVTGGGSHAVQDRPVENPGEILGSGDGVAGP